MKKEEAIKEWDNHGKRHVIGIVYELSRYFSKNNPINLIDVGANSGLFFDVFRKNIPINRAVLIEPNPDLASYAKEKYKNEPNIIVENFALSDSNSKYSFLDGGWEHHLLLPPEQMNLGGGKIVYDENGPYSCYSFDYLFSRYNLDRIDLVKVDTETEDLRILKGFTESVKKLSHRPIFCLENNWSARYTFEESNKLAQDFCSECKYKPIDITASRDFYLFPL